MFPPNNLICAVTTASPIHTIAKTPANTSVFCVSLALILRSVLSARQNTSGPQRSQSPMTLTPPPDPPDSSTSFASGHFLNVNLGYSTAFIFAHTAKMSRESVSQTDSSRVFFWARRSSPGIAEVRALGFRGAVGLSRGSSRSLISTGERLADPTTCRASRRRGIYGHRGR